MALGRLHYDGGGDWYANPSSLPNLARAIRAGTALAVEPREVVVRLTDEQLWSVPFLHATGHGNLSLTEADRTVLRRWLRQGGFLHVSDNYGMDESFRREMARLFPDQPLVPVPLDHPVFHLVYDLPAGVPKIHEHDGKPAEGLGVFLDGRLAVFYDYQADLGDPEWWGCLYDESRRNQVMAKSNIAEVNKVLKRGDWNEYEIRCEGKRIRLAINGQQAVDYTEPDDSIPQFGRIGLQIHGGGQAEASYKEITVKELP